MSKIVSLMLVAVVFNASCQRPPTPDPSLSATPDSPATNPAPATSTSTRKPAAVRTGRHLPEGWAWPFDENNAQKAFAARGIERPFDLDAVSKLAGKSPCAAVEVAPHVWIKPLCKLPHIGPPPAMGVTSEPPPTGNVPAAVDLRQSGLDGPIQNQQLVGVCWTFAASTVMENSLRRAGKGDLVAPMHILATSIFDEMWQKNSSTTAVTSEGGWPYDPVKACKLTTQPDEDCGQYYKVQAGSWKDDPELVTEKANADKRGVYHMLHGRTLQLGAALPAALAAAIAKGSAVFVGMKIDVDAWSNQVKGGKIADWVNGGAGHAIALVGYRTTVTGREFLVHNSWGLDWGDKGYAWVSDRMLVAFAEEVLLFDADGGSVPLKPASSASTPAPATSASTPPVRSPACAAGQAVDMVFGKCGKACPGGAAPVAGMCPVSIDPTPSASGCGNGQVHDFLTGTCAQQCANGQPPVNGICFS